MLSSPYAQGRDSAGAITSAALTALYDERDAAVDRLRHVQQAVRDFQRTARELEDVAALRELRGEVEQARRARAQAEQLRLCCVRLAGALNGPFVPARSTRAAASLAAAT